MKSLVLSALLGLAGTLAQAGTVDPAAAITQSSLNNWGSGYNVSYTLDFGALLGASDSLTGFTLSATAPTPGHYSGGWINGGNDATSCNANQSTQLAGYNASTFSFTSACTATAAKTFTFFLQGQGTFGLPTFALTAEALPLISPSTPIAQTPLPAAAWMLIAAIGGLFGLGARRRTA